MRSSAATATGSAPTCPLGAVLTFLRCWVRLYGMVSLEVFGHLHFALDDAAPMFEITLAELAGLVGLEYPPPRLGRPPPGAHMSRICVMIMSVSWRFRDQNP